MVAPQPGVDPSRRGSYAVESATVALDPNYLGVELSWYTYPLMVQYWYPKSPSGLSNPIVPVLILHGYIEDEIAANSYLGFDYLGQLLASNGFFCVSVQQPLEPGYKAFTSDRLSRIQGCLNWIVELNSNEHLDPAFQSLGAYLKDKLYCSSMAGVGHSAGGTLLRGLPNMAQFQNPNYQFGAISCIAPDIFPDNSPQTQQSLQALSAPTGIPFQIVHGSADCMFYGAYGGWVSYEDLLWSQTSVCKSWVMVDNANHNFFNTNWPIDECANASYYIVNPPLFPAIDTEARMAAQTAVAATYVHAFLQATLNNNAPLYVPFLNGDQPNPLLKQSAFQNSPFVNVRLDYRAPGSAVLLVDNFETPWNDYVRPNNMGGSVQAIGSVALSQISLQSNRSEICPVSTSYLLAARITWSASDAVVTETVDSTITFGRGAISTVLSFRVGVVEHNPPDNPPLTVDFNVALVDAHENSSHALAVSAYRDVGSSWASFTYPGSNQNEKIYSTDMVVRHSFMEVVRIPVKDFLKSGFNSSQTKMILFTFNALSSPAGDIVVDEIHFSNE